MQVVLSFAALSHGVTPANDVAVEGTIVNAGDDAIEVDLVELSAASLALQIVNAEDQPVRMLPPPTPGHPQLIVLKPGEQRSVTFRAFLTDAAPGRYRVRFRYRDAHSEWVLIDVV